jgi:hypothetical protein
MPASLPVSISQVQRRNCVKRPVEFKLEIGRQPVWRKRGSEWYTCMNEGNHVAFKWSQDEVIKPQDYNQRLTGRWFVVSVSKAHLHPNLTISDNLCNSSPWSLYFQKAQNTSKLRQSAGSTPNGAQGGKKRTGSAV